MPATQLARNNPGVDDKSHYSQCHICSISPIIGTSGLRITSGSGQRVDTRFAAVLRSGQAAFVEEHLEFTLVGYDR